MYQWELRLSFFNTYSAIQHLPLLSLLFLFLSFLFLIMLSSNGQLFKLFSVHFHVGADDLISDRGHSLVPMLLLGSILKASNYYGVGFTHIVLDHLLDQF